jgi:hypothetical protein
MPKPTGTQLRKLAIAEIGAIAVVFFLHPQTLSGKVFAAIIIVAVLPSLILKVRHRANA